MSYSAYQIIHTLPSGGQKIYVGITKRTIEERLNAHFNEDTRDHPRGISPFSLGYAIREHLSRDRTDAGLRRAFKIEKLQEFSSEDEMRAGEAVWISALDTMAPKGYNLMRGGSSIGGPSNSKPCVIFVNGAAKDCKSFAEAARTAAAVNQITGEIAIRRYVSRCRARVSSGWTPAEAFGFAPRDDGRSTALSREAKDAGENVATARSRAYRKKKSAELASVSPVRFLPDPDNLSKLIPVKRVFQRLGIPESTGRFRLRQILPVIHVLSSEEIFEHLQRAQDRMKLITVMIPDEGLVVMGVNEIARKFARPGHTIPVIKSRLRKLPTNANNNDILITLGRAKPTSKRLRNVLVSPISRKKYCTDWTIRSGNRTRVFVNQAEFARECLKWLLSTPIGKRFLREEPDDLKKAEQRIQKFVSLATKNGQTPTMLAEQFGILEALLSSGTKKAE